ncbi:Ldh family oxidoreductase [Clostridium sp.]|uniref:Ldh family oxidoreductase n=1 Tax=Clostridium sp. TaxID=1506 RepID=UPI002632510B|nr:Ldh family oxidoreductase [Clostridium sp.]
MKEIKKEVKTIKVSTKQLKKIVYKTFISLGLSEEDSMIAADVLNEADKRGVDTHGINRLGAYVNGIKFGKIDTKAKLTKVSDSIATILFDANNSLGLVAATKAMEECIKRAKETGICIVGVKGSSHLGITGYYPSMAAKENMIGISISNSSNIMVPYGSKTSILGNSPWSIAFPGGNKHKDPVLLDMACSEVAFGKIVAAKGTGEEIPLNWGVDEEGIPTNDVNKIFNGSSLLPFGGAKGYGIAVMWEMLITMLTGSGFGDVIGQGKKNSSPENIGHIMIAIDINKMRPIEKVKTDIDNYIDHIKTAKPAKGFIEVRLPGERIARVEQIREKDGIDFNIKLAEEILELLKKNNIVDEDETIEELFNL